MTEAPVLMPRSRPEVRPFGAEDVEPAGHLLAARHRAQRRHEPGLSASYEDPSAAAVEIATAFAADGASGAVAWRDGELIGYLIGAPGAASWGPNIWIPGAGHAVADGVAEVLRDLYGLAAAGWVEAGLTSHYALVPATDRAIVETWFRLGFGRQHTHAIREAPAPATPLAAPAGISIRRAERRDIPTLGRLDLVLDEHQTRSPVFSRLPLPDLADLVNDWEENIDDPRFTNFVAEHDGVVIGSAVGCSIDESSMHRGIVKPDRAGFLGFAAVLPEARGLGAGRALGEAVLGWAGDSGYDLVVTDWRETNLLSSRAWPRLGFRPTFLRLFRAIA